MLGNYQWHSMKTSNMFSYYCRCISRVNSYRDSVLRFSYIRVFKNFMENLYYKNIYYEKISMNLKLFFATELFFHELFWWTLWYTLIYDWLDVDQFLSIEIILFSISISSIHGYLSLHYLTNRMYCQAFEFLPAWRMKNGISLEF